jgi:hypothetical protein
MPILSHFRAVPIAAQARGRRRAILGLGLLLVWAGAAAAHHTYVTKYDANKVVTLSGTVSNVRYANPHIFFDLASGAATWTIETESIPVAQANGLTESVLKDGAKVTVTGWAGRDNAPEMGLKSISFAGGKTITMRKTAR